MATSCRLVKHLTWDVTVVLLWLALSSQPPWELALSMPGPLRSL